MSTDTNVGPREGPVKGLSQLMDTPMDGTSQYTLRPRGTLNKVIPVEKQRKLVRKIMYPRLCKLTEAAGFEYETNMEENAWSFFEEQAVPESVTSTLINVVRELDVKGKEWLTWTVVLRGQDKNNQMLGGIVVPYGVDFEPQIKSIRNSENVVTNLQLGTKQTPIHTEEFFNLLFYVVLSITRYVLAQYWCGVLSSFPTPVLS